MTKFRIILNTQWHSFKLLRIKTKQTEDLTKLRKLRIGAKGLLTVNIDMQDLLINGQTRNMIHIEFA